MYNCAYLTGLPAVGCGVKLRHCAILPPVGEVCLGQCRGGETGLAAPAGMSGWGQEGACDPEYNNVVSSVDTGIAFIFLLSERTQNRIDDGWQITKAGSVAELHN